MSNKHTSHQHGMTKINRTRPKSKLRKRRNKARARVLREARNKAKSEVKKKS